MSAKTFPKQAAPNYPGKVAADLRPCDKPCACRRFYAESAKYRWDDDLGWRHTRAKCYPKVKPKVLERIWRRP